LARQSALGIKQSSYRLDAQGARDRFLPTNARRPASVIRTRATSIFCLPAITRSTLALACPLRITSTINSIERPCASMSLPVQPSRQAASNSSARRRRADAGRS
jgi:hypothetical protein